MTSAQSRYLPQLFGRTILSELAATGRSRTFSYILAQAKYAGTAAARLWDVYEDVYAHLMRHYRCEYVYKNSLARRLVFERHSLATATLLAEFRVGTRKADVVVLNGTSSVYEIKTHLDNLDRLPAQIQAYRTVLDRIYVVTNETMATKVAAALDGDIGVIVLTDAAELEELRASASHASAASPDAMFQSLRQAEYRAIIRNALGAPTDFPSGIMWQECRKLFAQIPAERAHALMVQTLHQRGRVPGLEDFLASLPQSLQHAGLTANFRPKQRTSLVAAMLLPVPT